MANNTTYQNSSASISGRFSDYVQLVKFRLSMTVVMSSVLAYIIAGLATTGITIEGIVLITLGGFLVTGAANALNQTLERDFDKQMNRTKNRPVATGRMSVSEAVLAAGIMSAIGIMMLSYFNALTGLLGAISLIIYAFIYTPLKRVTPLSVTVGAIPGALPTMIGCVAIEGGITPLALLLFGIQFFWQYPHFWAIAELAKEDYRGAGFKIISETATAKTLGINALIQAGMLLPFVLGLYAYEYIGIVNLIFMTITTAIYMWFCWEFSRQGTRESALRLMFSSFAYLPAILLALVIAQCL